MTLADKKKAENIAEYILFIWQMEELVRVANFNSEIIAGFVNEGFKEADKEAELQWFQSLQKRMKSEGIVKKGHLSEISELLAELQYLHSSLLGVYGDKVYEELFSTAKSNLDEFSQKVEGEVHSEVELSLYALYGLLNLRLRGEKVSPETEKAMSTFSTLMAHLSMRYRQMKSGELTLNLN